MGPKSAWKIDQMNEANSTAPINWDVPRIVDGLGVPCDALGIGAVLLILNFRKLGLYRFRMRQMKSQTVIRLILTLLVAAYASFAFHELGHWLAGRLLGYEVAMDLNGTWIKGGQFTKVSHALYFYIGGPAFTLLQAVIALVIIERTKAVFVYPFVFFPAMMRVFPLAFRGYGAEDEARISAIMGLGTYTVGIVVCSILFVLLWRGSRTLKLNLKINSVLFLCRIAFTLMVVATNDWLFR